MRRGGGGGDLYGSFALHGTRIKTTRFRVIAEKSALPPRDREDHRFVAAAVHGRKSFRRAIRESLRFVAVRYTKGSRFVARYAKVSATLPPRYTDGSRFVARYAKVSASLPPRYTEGSRFVARYAKVSATLPPRYTEGSRFVARYAEALALLLHGAVNEIRRSRRSFCYRAVRKNPAFAPRPF